ncbi:MAG: hypothetical protein ABI274_13635 [Ktedonobacterales bacterium]
MAQHPTSNQQTHQQMAQLWLHSIRRLQSPRAERLVRGYLATLAGVALATGVIAAAQLETRIGNSSVLYLLAVL